LTCGAFPAVAFVPVEAPFRVGIFRVSEAFQAFDFVPSVPFVVPFPAFRSSNLVRMAGAADLV
jgi:hypothetical protein